MIGSTSAVAIPSPSLWHLQSDDTSRIMVTPYMCGNHGDQGKVRYWWEVCFATMYFSYVPTRMICISAVPLQQCRIQGHAPAMPTIAHNPKNPDIANGLS